LKKLTPHEKKMVMIEVTWRKYKSWSGAKATGGKVFTLQKEEKKRHMWRALWLTAQVEGGGRFGAVQSYDGAGISAGLEHKIAVYPRTMKQGSIWKLLREFELHAPCEPLEELWDALRQKKLYLAQDGSLRHLETGRLASGAEIRNLVAPAGGRVPQTGPHWEEAKRWVVLFRNLFINEATHDTQINSAIRSLVRGNGKNESVAYKTSVGVEHPTVIRYGKNISAEHDLAWCVYHSFSVNAPGKGRQRLTASRPDGTDAWPKRLIRTLGTTNYGRWHDTFDGGNRYDRTRIYAMRSGMWPEELFTGPGAIMPNNF
jgi:hypothetical protein